MNFYWVARVLLISSRFKPFIVNLGGEILGYSTILDFLLIGTLYLSIREFFLCLSS